MIPLNERGTTIFQECKNYLVQAGIYNEVFEVTLKIYAFNLANIEKLAKEIDTEGLTIPYTNKGGFKNEIMNPKVKIYQELNNCVQKMASLFGFTPMSRKKLRIEDVQKPKGKTFDLSALK
jgi:P27 family predicted phage terminase small subunit